MLVLAIATLGVITTHCVLATDSNAAVGQEGLRLNGLDLDNLHDSLDALDFHLRRLQKRTCKIGVQSHNCNLNKLDNAMKWKEYLSGSASPGKRTVDDGDQESQEQSEARQNAIKLLADLAEQRRAVETLKTLLRSVKSFPKRSYVCRVNLGGHCLTEELDKAADWYYYLSSGNSPGRRRRNVRSANQDQAR